MWEKLISFVQRKGELVAFVSIPQVVPSIGGFLDFFNKDTATMVEPVLNLYIESSRDGVGGESQLCSYKDFVDGIDAYITNNILMQEHGKNAREHILKEYKWCDLGNKLHNIINRVCCPQILNEAINVINNPKQIDVVKPESDIIHMDDINKMVEEVSLENLNKSIDNNDSKTVSSSKQPHLSERAVKLLKAKKKGKQLRRKK